MFPVDVQPPYSLFTTLWRPLTAVVLVLFTTLDKKSLHCISFSLFKFYLALNYDNWLFTYFIFAAFRLYFISLHWSVNFLHIFFHCSIFWDNDISFNQWSLPLLVIRKNADLRHLSFTFQTRKWCPSFKYSLLGNLMHMKCERPDVDCSSLVRHRVITVFFSTAFPYPLS